MRKLATPKRVTLPNARTVVARYKRVPRSELPANVTMARRYRGRVAPERSRRPPRKGQKGRQHFEKNSKKSISKTTWKKITDLRSKVI